MKYQVSASGHRGTHAIQRLVEYAPASGGLALWMQHRDVTVPPRDFNHQDNHLWLEGRGHRWTIANDGKTIFYSKDFTTLGIKQQTGLVAHQVLHVALQHASRLQALQQQRGQLDIELFNVAADAIINSSLQPLEWLTLPAQSIYLDTLLERVLGIEAPVIESLQRWDTESLYRAIHEDELSGQPAATPNQKTGDTNDSPSSHTGNNQQNKAQAKRIDIAYELANGMLRDLLPAEHHEQDQVAIDNAWRSRLQQASASDSEQSLLRGLLADIPTSRVPWQQILRTRLARSLAAKPSLSWSRPHRSWLANQGRTRAGHRMPWQPGILGQQPVSKLALILDISGSVEDTTLHEFSSEIQRLMRVHGAKIMLIAGDDRVRAEISLKPGGKRLTAYHVPGGGGTHFSPLIAAANRYKPDLMLCLTDLQGPMETEPVCPLIWLVPRAYADTPVPFGRIIVLDE